MRKPVRLPTVALAVLAALALAAASVQTQEERDRGSIRTAASRLRDVREWDARITQMERGGALRARKLQPDTLVAGRTFVRLAQYHRGVPVWGGEVVRAEDSSQVTLWVLTNLYRGISIATEPGVGADAAKRAIERLGKGTLGPDRVPQLVVYPMADGSYRLAYTQQVATLGDVRRYFVDARTLARLDDFSERFPQSSVGSGTGVLGDTKKVSTTFANGTYIADDGLRPPALHTFDLHGDPYKYVRWLNGEVSLYQSDMASDNDNVWTDVDAVDAHVHIGWSYDYFYKRFGRRGLNDNNSRVLPIVHVVRRQDFEYYIEQGLLEQVADFYINAFYIEGSGTFTFGEGLPSGWTLAGQTYDFLAGGLDIVAHEYAHGVTDYTSHLGGTGEPRSLNEAFSDMMGVSVDYYFRPSRANYTIGEEVVSGGVRSLADPAKYSHVDHYSKRLPWVGNEYENSTIASHAFYLAIEGGTNRTSHKTVQGVGAGSRDQVEKAFYRGFSSLTSNATFHMARVRTIDSAKTLYGDGSSVARAITEAWDAVGVF